MRFLIFYITLLLTLIVCSPNIGLAVDDAAKSSKDSFGALSADASKTNNTNLATVSSTTPSLTLVPTSNTGSTTTKQAVKTQASSSIKIEDAFIQEKVIHLDEMFHFIVRVSWEGMLDDFKVYAPKDPSVLGASIENLQVANVTTTNPNKSTTEFTYTLKPSEIGNGSISPVEINYSYKEKDEKLLLTTRVVAFTIETTPKDWSKMFGWIFMITVGIGIIVLMTLSAKGYFQKTGKTGEEAEKRTPYDDLLVASRELSQHTEDSDAVKFYDGILNLLLKFLSIYSNKQVKKFTNKELYEFLETTDFEQEVKDKILSMYYQCEQVLYGGSSPQSFERKALIRDISNLIEDKIAEHNKQPEVVA